MVKQWKDVLNAKAEPCESYKLSLKQLRVKKREARKYPRNHKNTKETLHKRVEL